MKLIIVFGLPGAGKTYLASLIHTKFNYYLIEGDDELSPQMIDALEHKVAITSEMRDEFFQKILARILSASSNQEKVIVSQTYIKHKYRQQIREKFPQAIFIYVEADKEVRRKRLETIKRKGYNLDVQHALNMEEYFDPPEEADYIIKNNLEGADDLLTQINSLISAV
jgi:carbohydrate kinase (thermoresistant glucokinase family)